MKLIEEFSLEPQREKILGFLDCQRDNPASLHIEEVLDSLIQDIGDIISPKAAYSIEAVTEAPDLPLSNQCSHVIYCAATLGEEVSRQCTELFEKGSYLEGYILNALSDFLLFELENQLYDRVFEDAEHLCLGLTSKYEPGNNDIPLSLQSEIIEKLQTEESIGVTATEAYMLSPIKSISFIYGASAGICPEKKRQDCSSCSSEECKYKSAFQNELTIINGSTETILKVSPGTKLLDILREHIPDFPSDCGGTGKCGKCRIQVIKGSSAPSTKDLISFDSNQLEEGHRLACSSFINQDTVIKVSPPPDGKYQILTEFSSKAAAPDSYIKLVELTIHKSDFDSGKSMTQIINGILGCRYVYTLSALENIPGVIGDTAGRSISFNAVLKDRTIIDIKPQDNKSILGIAVDIGTTTIALGLIDLLTGESIGTASLLNSQKSYGADVISRISACSQGHLGSLTKAVRSDILKAIEDLCSSENIDCRNIYTMVIAGNTTMLHLLMGFDCSSLGQYPFNTVTNDTLYFGFSELFQNSMLNCQVILLPGVSAFVGADITAGMLYCGFSSLNSTKLLIDIGTNGEIAIGSRDSILCLSTAAGPAFEGANITHGIGSITGAISQVCINNGQVAYKTLGQGAPIGICGSGVIDVTAECLRNNIIDTTGRFSENYQKCDLEIAKNQDSTISFSQKDIREVQLAKSAIRTGIDILIESFGCNYKEIDEVCISGGFGNYININNASAIGLIPKELEGKIHTMGNSVLGGAAYFMLHEKSPEEMASILEKAQYIEISMAPGFNDLFIDNMSFETK